MALDKFVIVLLFVSLASPLFVSITLHFFRVVFCYAVGVKFWVPSYVTSVQC